MKRVVISVVVLVLIGIGAAILILTGGAYDPFLHDSRIKALAWSESGKVLASSGHDGLRVWDLQSGTQLFHCKPKNTLDCISATPSGTKIAYAGGGVESGLYIVDYRGKSLRKEFELPPSTQARSLSFSPNGALLAMGFSSIGVSKNDHARVTVYDVRDWRAVFEARGDSINPDIVQVAFSGKGDKLAIAGKDGTVRILDASEWKEIVRNVVPGRISAIAWRGQLDELAVALEWNPQHQNMGSNLFIWDLSGLNSGLVTVSYAGPIGSLMFSQDGRFLAWAGGVGLVRVMDMNKRQPIWEVDSYPVDPGSVGAGFGDQVTFTWDGRFLVTAGDNKRIVLWDLLSRAPARR